MRALPLAALSLILAACASKPSSAGPGADGGVPSDGGMGGQPVIGGDRPVTVEVPSNYKPGTPAPLLIMLHGYSVNGVVEEVYLQLAPVADQLGFLYAHPDGTLDNPPPPADQNYFWNATDACCNYYGSTVDDSAYLDSVIKGIEAAYSVDPKRVYFLGHSNGAFMSYRMACDHASDIAAIVSLEGAMWEDTTKCQPSEPVHVLAIHGDADTEVLYNGAPAGSGAGMGAYPSAPTSVADWVAFDGCSATADPAVAPLDLDESIPGAETTVQSWSQGCKPGGSAALWTVKGGMHLPTIGDTFRRDVFQFLLAHPKP
jgi:polyhydroxybutyrate depolymerase